MSSQKIENLQVRLELAATKSKDILQQYSQQGKSAILHVWNSTRAEEIKHNAREAYEFLVTAAGEFRYRFAYYANPRRIYMSIMKFIGANKLSERDVFFIVVGLVFGGIVGVAVGLSLRQKQESVHYMQAIQLKHCLGVESAQVVEDAVAPHQCGDYDVLITVKASSVQIIDAQICCGYGRNIGRILRRLNKQPEFPLTLGRDCTGIVVDLGSKVKRVDVGDEVWLTVPFWCQGTLCQTILISESRVSRKPKNIGFEGACSLPYAGSLALAALNEANLTIESAHDKRVLIQGACTPVGCVLIQILNHWNAHVTVTSYKRAVPVAKALGAEEIVVISDLSPSSEGTSSPDSEIDSRLLFKELELLGPIFDAIIDTQNSILSSNYLKKLLVENGVFVSTLPPPLSSDSFGFIGQLFLSSYVRVLFLFKKIVGLPLEDFDEKHMCYVALDKLTELVEDGYLQTVVEKVFHPHDIEIALNHIQSPQSIGSTIITFR